MSSEGAIDVKVHDAAQHLGVTPRTLRFYEEKGLVHPQKEPQNGYRIYTEDDLTRLRWVVSLRELGMPVADIHDALQSAGDSERFARIVDNARLQLYEEWVAATKALQALDRTIRSWRLQGETSLEEAERAAEHIKQNRALRSSWNDAVRFDEMALRYGVEAPLAAMEGLLTAEQYEHALIQTMEWIDPKRGEAGLELGGGSGNLSVMLAGAAVNLTIVEQSAEMVSLLRGRVRHVEVLQGNMLALPLSGRAYSFVCCSFAFHHLSGSQQLLSLEEADRVLLPGGRIVITDLATEITSHEAVSYPALKEWLTAHGYSVVVEPLNESVRLLFALRTEFQ